MANFRLSALPRRSRAVTSIVQSPGVNVSDGTMRSNLESRAGDVDAATSRPPADTIAIDADLATRTATDQSRP